MHHNFPTLKFIHKKRLYFHEVYEGQRTDLLINRIKDKGNLKNPPVVSPFLDGKGGYLILDGANRVKALTGMDFPHILTQVIIKENEFTLDRWNHVVFGLSLLEFLDSIQKLENHRVVITSLNERRDYDQGATYLEMLTNEGDGFNVAIRHTNTKDVVKLLNLIVSLYSKSGEFDRTSLNNLPDLRDIYPYFQFIIKFPKFNLREIQELAGKQVLLPPGITRFIITPRALRLNYPLVNFDPKIPLTEKNEILKEWIRKRNKDKRIRYYSETTWLFDE